MRLKVLKKSQPSQQFHGGELLLPMPFGKLRNQNPVEFAINRLALWRSALIPVLAAVLCIASGGTLTAAPTSKNSDAVATKPDEDSDLDGNGQPQPDGLTNAEEAAAGTLPFNPDTDGDALLDGNEAVPSNASMKVPRAKEPKYAVIPMPEGHTALGVNSQGDVLLVEETQSGPEAKLWRAGQLIPIGPGESFRGPLDDGSVYVVQPYSFFVLPNASGYSATANWWTANSTTSAGIAIDASYLGYQLPTITQIPSSPPPSVFISPVLAYDYQLTWNDLLARVQANLLPGQVFNSQLYRDLPPYAQVLRINDARDRAFKLTHFFECSFTNPSTQSSTYFAMRLNVDGWLSTPDFFSSAQMSGILGTNTSAPDYGHDEMLVNSFSNSTFRRKDSTNPEGIYKFRGAQGTKDLPGVTRVLDINKQVTTEGPYLIASHTDGNFLWCYNSGNPVNHPLGNVSFVTANLPEVVSRQISSDLIIPTGAGIWRNQRNIAIEDLVGGTGGLEGLSIEKVSTTNQFLLGSGYDQVSGNQRAALLVPLDVTFESVGDNDPIKDNKKKAFAANGDPLPDEWMPGKGKLVFPDKKSPTDTIARNSVYVKVVGMPKDWKVLIKAFDVDDQTPTSIDPDNFIDQNDDSSVKRGNDNFGYDVLGIQQPPIFESSGNVSEECIADSNGLAKLSNGELPKIVTTMQPGDNLRVAVVILKPDGSPLEGQNIGYLQVVDSRLEGYLTGDSEKLVVGFNGALSPTLTMWRRLWLEFDSMGQAPLTGSEKNYDEGSINAYADNGNGTSTIHVTTSLSDEAGRYENGEIEIAGIGKYSVVSNTDGLFGDDVVIQGVPGNSTVGKTFKIHDDDIVSLSPIREPRTMPYQLSGGNLIYTSYADTYVLPVPAPESNFNNDATFNRNINNVLEWYSLVREKKNLESAYDFWTAYLLAAWQGEVGADADPDPQGFGETTLGEANDPFNEGAIYIEAVREGEFLPSSPRIQEEHVVVHEIGHQGGGDHDDGGIMSLGAPINKTKFTPITIKKFRENANY